jgi:hypothetical protein
MSILFILKIKVKKPRGQMPPYTTFIPDKKKKLSKRACRNNKSWE